MTREIIEDFRFIVIPYMVNRLKEINYEGQGGSDAEEFMSNFNEICDLAIKALGQEPTTNNDLGVDCISRQEVLRLLANSIGKTNTYLQTEVLKLPSVTPQEPKTFKWCTDCKEYDQEKHCCHRWSKVIRDTVEEMKQEQEPILDKIRAEISDWQTDIHDNEYDAETHDFVFERIYEIIDEYKAESEG